MYWTLRVVSTLLIGPQGGEKNCILWHQLQLFAQAWLKREILSCNVLQRLFSQPERTLGNNLVKADILQNAHFQVCLFPGTHSKMVTCFKVHKAHFPQLMLSVSAAPVFPV